MGPVQEIAASGGFGLMAGALSGFLGMGGGAILAPLLVLALGVDQHRAQGISLAALVPPVGLPALISYRRSGVLVRGGLVGLLILGFLGGALFGAWLAHRIPTRQLGWFFIGFLVVSAVRALWSLRADHLEPPVSAEQPQWVGVPIGVVAGVMSGLLGVGGGIVALPLLRRFAGLGRLEAQATTMAMMLPPIGLPAVFVYASEQGGLPWALLIAVAVGFTIGTGLGAHWAGSAKPKLAALIYAGFLSLMAALLLLRT